MKRSDNNTTQQKIEEIQKIYALFLNKLNELKKEKNEVVQKILKRISDQKVAEILQELKDKY